MLRFTRSKPWIAAAALLAASLPIAPPPAQAQDGHATEVERRPGDAVDVWTDVVAGLGAARDGLAAAGARFEQLSRVRDRRYGAEAGRRLETRLDGLIARTDRQPNGRPGRQDPLLTYLFDANDGTWERAVGHIAIMLMNTRAALEDARAVDPAMVPERAFQILVSLSRGPDLLSSMVGGLQRPTVAEELNLFMAARDRYLDYVEALYYADSAVEIYLAAIRQ